MANSAEQKFLKAARGGRVSKVSSLLRSYPGIDVNCADPGFGLAALHIASFNGHVEVVKLLLAHPDINVNFKDYDGFTPFAAGCVDGELSVVQLLLKDPRVDVTLDDHRGRTPLWHASDGGNYEMVEWFIASGRDLGDIKTKKGKSSGDGKKRSALAIARRQKNTEVVSLLKKFMANPEQTRHEVRAKLGVLDEVAAEVYALTIFLCDGLLQLKPASHPAVTAAAAATRFFLIVKRLPMELQMILCHSVVDSAKDSILSKNSEAAFKSLARILCS